MNNLFVCHTQAHLILACGLAQGRFSEDNNELILFTDFSITPQIMGRLNNVFSKILYLTGIYPAINKSWKRKISRYPSDIYKIKKFMSITYDKLFVVVDALLPEKR